MTRTAISAPAPEPDDDIPVKAPNDNLLDNPISLLFEQWVLGAFYFVAFIHSTNVLPLLRYRIGERLLRLWMIFLNGGIIMGIGLAFISTQAGVILFFYGLLATAAGYYQNGCSKEWGELPPGLHTMTRGISFLQPLYDRLLRLHWPMYCFTRPGFYCIPLSSYGDRLAHNYAEPVLVILIGCLLWFLSPLLALWLAASGLSLMLTEHRYYESGRTYYLDKRDAGLQSRALASSDSPIDAPNEIIPVRYAETKRRMDWKQQLQKHYARLRHRRQPL